MTPMNHFPEPGTRNGSKVPQVPTRLARATMALAVTYVLVSLVALPLTFAAADTRVVWLLGSVVLVAAYVVGCLWLQRSHEFVRTVHPGYHMRHTAVGVWIGWWLPVFGLWFPYQVVYDIRDGTPAVDRPMRSTGTWWAAWIFGAGLQSAVTQIDGNPSYPNLQESIGNLQLAATLLLVIACVLWVRIVSQVTSDQHAHHRESSEPAPDAAASAVIPEPRTPTVSTVANHDFMRAAPTTGRAGHVRTAATRKPARIPEGLAQAAGVLAIVYTVGFAAMTVVALVAPGQRPDGRAGSLTTGDVLSLVLLGLTIPIWVVGCLWLQRSYRFVLSVYPGYQMRHGLGWLWCGWWVPLACWWVPYRVVYDLRHGTMADDRPITGMRWWWACWLLSPLPLTFGSAGNAWLDLVAALLLALACVKWLGIVRAITVDQRDQMARPAD